MKTIFKALIDCIIEILKLDISFDYQEGDFIKYVKGDNDE